MTDIRDRNTLFWKRTTSGEMLANVNQPGPEGTESQNRGASSEHWCDRATVKAQSVPHTPEGGLQPNQTIQ